MKNEDTSVIARVGKLERELQKLKVYLYLRTLKKKPEKGIYSEENILSEIRRIRKKLWNEKHSRGNS